MKEIILFFIALTIAGQLLANKFDLMIDTNRYHKYCKVESLGSDREHTLNDCSYPYNKIAQYSPLKDLKVEVMNYDFNDVLFINGKKVLDTAEFYKEKYPDYPYIVDTTFLNNIYLLKNDEGKVHITAEIKASFYPDGKKPGTVMSFIRSVDIL